MDMKREACRAKISYGESSMERRRLSDKQHRILKFVFDQINLIGRPPTIREICEQFGFASPRSASDHLKAIEKKGYLRRTKSPRGIELAYDKVWELFGIPIYERLAPDATDLSQAEIADTVTPSDLYPVSRGLFAVHMPDDSLRSEGVRRGDLLIAREQAEARPGDVAIVAEDDGMTARTVAEAEGGRVLQAADPDVPPLPAADARLFGVVLRVVRDL